MMATSKAGARRENQPLTGGFMALRFSHDCRWAAGAVCLNPHSLGNPDTFSLKEFNGVTVIY